MARTNQRLINYHTGKKTEMPSGSSVDYGEIVVRHNAESPELLIKIGDDSFGVFQASGAVKTAINSAVSAAKSELNGKISNIETGLTEHVATFNTFKGDVEKTYATKDELKSASGSIITAYTEAVADAKVEIYDSATTFATNEVSAAEGRLNTAIKGVDSKVGTLSEKVDGISTNIGENYVTTGKLSTTLITLRGEISAAQKDATDASSAYTDTKFTAAKEYSDGKLSAATETLKGNIANVSSSVSTLSANVHTTITNVQTALTETINNKVATAYRFQGSCTYADLANKEKVNGYVWNVTDAHGNVPAGTNYAWSEKDNSWDALGGTVDLSPYAKTADVNKQIQTITQSNTNLKSNIDDLSASTVSIKTTADSAVQTGTTNNGSGVVATKNGTTLNFDFSGLIIDCGDF